MLVHMYMFTSTVCLQVNVCTCVMLYIVYYCMCIFITSFRLNMHPLHTHTLTLTAEVVPVPSGYLRFLRHLSPLGKPYPIVYSACALHVHRNTASVLYCWFVVNFSCHSESLTLYLSCMCVDYVPCSAAPCVWSTLQDCVGELDMSYLYVLLTWAWKLYFILVNIITCMSIGDSRVIHVSVIN